MSDLKEEPPSTITGHPYPALRLMELAAPPLRFGRQPTWKLPALPVEAPLIPAWNWHAVRDFPPGAEIVTLTENGPYLAALATVKIAHGALNHIGPYEYQPAPDDVAPGYYRITVPRWAFSGSIVSPLGDSARLETEDTVWVAAPTVSLLLELERDGYLGAFRIVDSWTAPVQNGFRTWAQTLRANRSQFLDQVEAVHPDGETAPAGCDCAPCRRYQRFEASVNEALTGMLTGAGTDTHRPDWAHTVYAAHSADMWKKAWRYSNSTRPLVAMPHLDEVIVPREDLQKAMEHTERPFQVDLSGRTVGALRILSYGHLEANLPTGSATTLADDEGRQQP